MVYKNQNNGCHRAQFQIYRKLHFSLKNVMKKNILEVFFYIRIHILQKIKIEYCGEVQIYIR